MGILDKLTGHDDEVSSPGGEEPAVGGAQEFTLRIRRYDPESGEAPYWDEHTIELEPHRSVLEGILQAKNRFDGSIGIRCSCKAAICGSCGVRVNGNPGLACHTHLDLAQRGAKDGVIEIEPMGNMPVIKDLVVDMDAVHWKKVRRVTPWLLSDEANMPEREHIVSRESMVDITQSMACIQCGACVSDCLSMEVDPLFVGPAALAKAYRFVGDPRDTQHAERLNDLAQDPHGIYDCTHCFKCIEACPKGVAPMSQIMRLRRRTTSDFAIKDRNNGFNHEHAFVKNIRKNGLLHENDLLADSFGGKANPKSGAFLAFSLPAITRALLRGKATPKVALTHPHRKEFKGLKSYFDKIEERDERVELNLYITGYDEAPGTGDAQEPTEAAAGAQGDGGQSGAEAGTPGLEPEESPTR